MGIPPHRREGYIIAFTIWKWVCRFSLMVQGGIIVWELALATTADSPLTFIVCMSVLWFMGFGVGAVGKKHDDMVAALATLREARPPE